MNEATYEAPANIALIKYWGLRDEALVLPYNPSLSVTLDRVRSRTRVVFDPKAREDELVMNGVADHGSPRKAVSALLDRIRAEAGRSDHARVTSSNNFPTASGMASSASGFAALAGAGAYAAGLKLSPQRLSQLARFGSGSACRSLFGGFVEWRAGTREDGADCYARAVLPESHWPEFRDVAVLVADAVPKKRRSARAMQFSIRTAPGYAARIEAVPRRLAELRRALRRKDPERLFPLIMEECDEFREICETTRPSFDYLTATSRRVLAAVREVNEGAGHYVAAYTHDAGAHVHVFTLEPDHARVHRILGRVPGVAELRTLRPGPGGHLITGRAGPSFSSSAADGVPS
jgi:diphosphomevalonate decarboxylase